MKAGEILYTNRVRNYFSFGGRDGYVEYGRPQRSGKLVFIAVGYFNGSEEHAMEEAKRLVVRLGDQWREEVKG